MHVVELGSFEGTPQQLRQLVLDQLTTYPESHNQRDWGRNDIDCGTVACVAGWAMLFADGFVTKSHAISSKRLEARGAELLSLSPYDAIRLFYMVTEAQARMALKFLANDEQVDWDAVGHKYRSDEQMKTVEAMLKYYREDWWEWNSRDDSGPEILPRYRNR